MKGINEIMGLQCITRKRLLSEVIYSKMKIALTPRRKKNDRHGIRAFNGPRSSPQTQGLQVYRAEVHPQWHPRGCQSWWRIQSEARGIGALHYRKHQAEINKAARQRQMTINDFTAVRLFPTIGTRKEQPLVYPAYLLVYEPCTTKSRCRYTRRYGYAEERRYTHE